MSPLQSMVTWVVMIAVIMVAILVVKRSDASEGGFKDVVKNPDYWRLFSESRQDVEKATEAAKNWDDETVASVTRHYILEVTSSREAWVEGRILKALEERTHATVLALLGEAGLYARLVKPTGKDTLPEAPFNRACDLLGDVSSVKAVAVLSPFLDDPSDEIRKDAALVIAKTGAFEIIPHVRKAFADSDEYVRSYALMGLEFAVNRARLAENVPVELFPNVRDLLSQGKNADKAASILFRFDARKAEEFFLSAEIFNPDSRIVHEALKTLAEAKVAVPRDKLLALIASLEAADLKYPKTYALGEALRLLGQHRNSEDRGFLAARLTHAEERAAEGAAAGLLCSHGLEGVQERIWKMEEKSGYAALPDHQRYYLAVIICDAEINNGGLAQYFVNSSGDHWRDAIAGFEAMKSKERLGVLREAVALFGADGPSAKREERQNQLSKLYRKDDAIFEELDSRYYESKEVIEVLSIRFVLANPESFR